MSAQIDSGAAYHALPTAPHESHDDNPDSEIAVDHSGTDNSVTEPIDSRVLWVYFMLGCAVLLPWNGAF